MTNGDSWLATAGKTVVQALGLIITLVAMEVGSCTKQVDPPAPEPVKIVVADPESWLILDSQGVRTTDAALEKVAGALKPGKWTAQAIPKPGEKGYTLSIVVDDGVKPKPEPPKPEPPKPPEPPTPPVVISGKRALLMVYESSEETPEIGRLITKLRSEKYLTEKSHTLAVIDDDDIDASGKPAALVEAWRPHFAGVKLPALLIIDPATKTLIHKAEMPATVDGVLSLLKSHGG